jgi:hypothetical protein
MNALEQGFSTIYSIFVKMYSIYTTQSNVRNWFTTKASIGLFAHYFTARTYLEKFLTFKHEIQAGEITDQKC